MQLTEPDLDKRFAEAMGDLLGPNFPTSVGLAVSGGADSMSMLALAHNWARVWGVNLRVVTVDHGLRSESADEAQMVAAECAALGHIHHVMQWNWDGQGNVQDAARRARLALINQWRGDLRHVLMAHTSDDVAETFLIRLARGSGVEGLSAMSARRSLAEGYEVLRPCLQISRAELRHYAKTLHIPFADDPSNDNPAYDRARARAMLDSLGDLGLRREDLTNTARRMARARDALRARAVSVADELCIENTAGAVIFDRSGFERVERDTQMRLLAAACAWVSGAEYRPRAESLEQLLDRLLAGGKGTLIGAEADMNADTCVIYRELARISETGPLWDGRWRIIGQIGPDIRIRAVGESLKICPDWRDLGLPRAALMATPGVFQGETLLAAPAITNKSDWKAQIVTTFTTYLLSH